MILPDLILREHIDLRLMELDVAKILPYADAYLNPFKVSTLGFFYMRIGEDDNGTGVPRRPLWIPNTGPCQL